MIEHIDLGPCCACEKTGPTVRNILQLHKNSPIPGHGWGNLVIGMPSIAAAAVLCDECLGEQPGRKPHKPIRFACRGYPATEGRVPIEELTDLDSEWELRLRALAEQEETE